MPPCDELVYRSYPTPEKDETLDHYRERAEEYKAKILRQHQIDQKNCAKFADIVEFLKDCYRARQLKKGEKPPVSNSLSDGSHTPSSHESITPASHESITPSSSESRDSPSGDSSSAKVIERPSRKQGGGGIVESFEDNVEEEQEVASMFLRDLNYLDDRNKTEFQNKWKIEHRAGVDNWLDHFQRKVPKLQEWFKYMEPLEINQVYKRFEKYKMTVDKIKLAIIHNKFPIFSEKYQTISS